MTTSWRRMWLGLTLLFLRMEIPQAAAAAAAGSVDVMRGNLPDTTPDGDNYKSPQKPFPPPPSSLPIEAATTATPNRTMTTTTDINNVKSRWWKGRHRRRTSTTTVAFLKRRSHRTKTHNSSRTTFLKRALSSSVSNEWQDQWKRGLEKQRDAFMDRVSIVSSWLDIQQGKKTSDDEAATDPDAITKQSNLEVMPPRSIHIVTTAALPWYTGTAINPLLRAAYLYQTMVERYEAYEKQQQALGSPNSTTAMNTSNVSVTLVVPWLELAADQEQLYHTSFASPAVQEEYIRKWLVEQANLPEWVAQGLGILFYPARYHSTLKSIFAMGDLIQTVILQHNTTELDVCILEEPEHCNWYRAPGDSWLQRFHYVVGIIHTNYKEYAASSHYTGLFTAPALAMICSAMVRAYCHKVIKLSDTLQVFSPGKEVTNNVHGVREEFWQQGLELARQQSTNAHNNNELDLLQEPRVYFLGKLLWAKGLDIMLDMQEYYKKCVGSYFEIDIYGSGPDSEAIQRSFSKSAYRLSADKGGFVSSSLPSLSILAASSTTLQSISTLGNSLQIEAKRHWSNIKNSLPVDMPKTMQILPSMMAITQRGKPIPARFLGRVDHAQLPHSYTVFVNPSISEVLCTATAEALAMGKFAIIPYHPSNYWFFQFPNCLPYRNKLEFVANLRWALNQKPKPLTAEQAHQFSWQAATERLFSAASMTHREAKAAMDLSSTMEGERIAWFHNEVLGKGPRGDLIRKLFGAGPVSAQVQYQQQNQVDSEREGEAEDEGLGEGFARSWFATAIRTTWNDMAKAFGPS